MFAKQAPSTENAFDATSTCGQGVFADVTSAHRLFENHIGSADAHDTLRCTEKAQDSHTMIWTSHGHLFVETASEGRELCLVCGVVYADSDNPPMACLGERVAVRVAA